MPIVQITREQAQRLFDFCEQNKQTKFCLAKDQGAYFCGIAIKDKDNPDKTVNCVEYIDGFNPDKDDDWYHNARAQFGGDDFGELLPLRWLRLFLTHPSMSKQSHFKVSLSEEQIMLVN